MLDLLAKTVWRIAFGDYDFAIDRKTLQYRLEETKTGTVWADGLPVGSVELEDRETGARTVYDFADAKLVTLSEKAGAHGKRILFGLDLLGIPIDIYFTCAPREIQLTVEASRDTRAHRVQTVRLLPGLCAAPRQEGFTAHLVAPIFNDGLLISADYPSKRFLPPYTVWDALLMPFIGATQTTSEGRTALALLMDSAYCAAEPVRRAADNAIAFDLAYDRDPERRRIDVRVAVLPGENHVGIARAYREKIIGERNHVILRRKVRERPRTESLFGAAFIHISPTVPLDQNDAMRIITALQDNCDLERAVLFGYEGFGNSPAVQQLPDGWLLGDSINYDEKVPVDAPGIGAFFIDHLADTALSDDVRQKGGSRWDEMEERLKLAEEARRLQVPLGTRGKSDWVTSAVDYMDSGNYSPGQSGFESVSVPLHAVVYHDCVITPLFFAQHLTGTFLGALLCLSPPKYYIDVSRKEPDLPLIKRTYAVLGHLHKFCWASFLTSHEFLTLDHAVQEARYSNGAHVIINTNLFAPFENEFVSLPPLGFYASCKEMTAHDAYRVGPENFETRAWRIARSQDGKPLVESGNVIQQEFPGPEVVRIAVGFGSNIGDREAYLQAGLEGLASRGVTWRAISSVYETEPVGPADQGPYLNLVAEGELQLGSPGLRALLHMCRVTEGEQGRVRDADTIRWGPRTLDIDILIYGDETTDEPDLTVPHRELTNRAFVLVPLAEIAPDWVVPGTNRTVGALAETAPGREEVRVWRFSDTKRPM